MSANANGSAASLLPFAMGCILYRPSSIVYTAFFTVNILLLLPVCVLVLRLGVQRWRRQQQQATPSTASCSDIFTFHLAGVELFGVLGCFLCCCSTYIQNRSLLWAGYFLWTFSWFGEMLLQIVICMERYLAVVHPVTYLSLRGGRGIRIRDGCIGAVWLLSGAGIGLMASEPVFINVVFWLVASSVTINSFCSLCILCVLIRPKPGGRQRVDQAKLRALYTVVAILAVLLPRFLFNLLWSVVNVAGPTDQCDVIVSGIWFNTPSSLLLPLLFLHRAGTLSPRSKNTEK